MQVKSSTGRIVELDGLRGIAILLVISFHYINNQLVHATGSVGKLLYLATSFGWVGVDLFFVLSGFLIGNILLVNKNSGQLFKTFFIRRIVRIIPNYYLLLLVFVIIGLIPYFSTNRFLTGMEGVPMWSYFTMVHNFFMAAHSNMGNEAISVTWSIGIEEQFYLVFPFIIYLIKDRWLPYLLVLLMFVAVASRAMFTSWIPAYVLLPCRVDALSMGVLIAWLNLRPNFSSTVNRYYKYLLLIPLLVVFFCGFLFIRYQDLGVAKNTLFSIFFGFVLLATLTRQASWFSKALRNGALVWVGVLSYSLYLFHYLVLGIFHHLSGKSDGIGIYNGTDILISIGALIFSFLIARLIYVYLETPAVQIGKRFKY